MLKADRLGWAGLGSLVAVVLMAGAAAAQDAKTVAVTSIVEHPALDAARDGIRDALAAAGFVVGENLTFEFQTAQGNPATAVQIARQFVGMEPDVIVPISTPSAQAVVSATQDIPVVFTAVTDPVGAQLVTDLAAPGANVTGISDMSPLAEHLALIREITPDAVRIGVPYNPGEANAVTLVRELKRLAAEQGFEIVEAAAQRSADVQAAAQSLVGNVDVIYVPTDNTIVSALQAVLGVGVDNQIPVYAGDTDSVVGGAVATVGFDYFQIGRETGVLVAEVLNGADPGSIPVRNATGTDLFVNPAAAESMGLTIPQAVIDRAHTVVE